MINTTTPSFDYDILLANKLKNILPDTLIVAVGPHVTVLFDSVLKTYNDIDIIALGEYDYTIREIADSLPDLSRVAGVAYRKNGKTVHRLRKLVENLDDLPRLPYDLVDLYAYREHSFPATKKPYATIAMSRGCACTCNFCLWPQVLFHGRVRFHSPERIIDDICWLKKEFGVRFVYFEDDYINILWERVEELCGLLIRKNVRIPWGCLGRTEGVTSDRLKLMKRAGLYLIKYGLETASEESLSKLDKECDLEQFGEAVRLTRKEGIVCHLTTMVGIIGDSPEKLDRTLKYVHRIGPDSVQFSICTPYPGTRLYRECQEKGILNYSRWEDFDGMSTSVIRLQHFTNQGLIRARDKAYLTYYTSFPCVALRLRRMIMGPLVVSQWIRCFQLIKRFVVKLFFKR